MAIKRTIVPQCIDLMTTMSRIFCSTYWCCFCAVKS